MFRDFWQLYVKEYRGTRKGLLICAVTVAAAMLEGLNVGLLVPLLEAMQGGDEGGQHWVSRALTRLFNSIGLPFEIGPILLVLGILILGVLSLKYLRMVLVARTRERFILWLRSRQMRNLLHADLSYFHGQKLGAMSDTVTTQASNAGATVQEVGEIVAGIALISAYLLAAFIITPVLAAISLALLVVVTLAMQYYIAKARAQGRERADRQNELQAATVEELSGIHVIKSFLLENLKWKDFWKKAEEVGEINYSLSRNQTRMLTVQEVVGFTLLCGIVLLGISVLDLGIATVIALVFVLYRVTPRLAALNGHRYGLAASLASLHKVKEAIDATGSPTIIAGQKPFVSLRQGIKLDQVSFSYDNGTQALQDASFIIEPGKLTAIVGASGAGKTTLIDLILRHYDPVEGSILVDGVDLRQLDLFSWRSSIGLVSQDVFLFNDTVARNIDIGRPDVTQESVVAAATQAYAHGFIQELPHGYETLIGDRGWNLSGGQRQRLALARAIVKSPDILILDEATSSLDSESERLIQDYMNRVRGNCTIIVVAHRLSTIRNADKIVVLEDGRVVEEGDWEDLIASAGVFAHYHELQGIVTHT